MLTSVPMGAKCSLWCPKPFCTNFEYPKYMPSGGLGTGQAGIYIEAPDYSSGKRRQNIHICYDIVGFIPVGTLKKQETA